MNKISKTKAISLIDEKISQFEIIKQNAKYTSIEDNTWDHKYELAYHGSEVLLNTLFGNNEGKTFKEKVSSIGSIMDSEINYAKELEDYKKHINSCIAQLLIYKEQIINFWEDDIETVKKSERLENLSYKNKTSNNKTINNNNIFSILIDRYKLLLKNATYENRYKGDYQTLKIETENIIENKYGKDGLKNYKGLSKIKAYSLGSPINKLKELEDYKDEIGKIISKLEGYKNLVAQNMKINNLAKDQNSSNKIFIGHGGSLVWRELKDFINEKLNLSCEEFNSVPVPGNTVTERLEDMLDNSCFALLIMTGEDEQKDKSVRARENVVHEIGLFQGRLGFEKAIILLEDGCDKFSNIDGLIYISFPKGKIKSAFQDIRDVLERENIL